MDDERNMLDELALFPDLSYYYGIGFFDLLRMPNWAIMLYARALNRLQASDEALMARAAAFPHLKKSARGSYAGQLQRRMRDGLKRRPARRLSLEQIEGAALASGIGFVREPRR